MDPYANLALQLNNGIPMPLPPPPPAPLAHLAPPLAVVPPAVADPVPAFLPAPQLAAEAAPIQPAPLPAVSVPESHARVMSGGFSDIRDILNPGDPQAANKVTCDPRTVAKFISAKVTTVRLQLDGVQRGVSTLNVSHILENLQYIGLLEQLCETRTLVSVIDFDRVNGRDTSVRGVAWTALSPACNMRMAMLSLRGDAPGGLERFAQRQMPTPRLFSRDGFARNDAKRQRVDPAPVQRALPCFEFNDTGACTRADCRYANVCSTCGGPHARSVQHTSSTGSGQRRTSVAGR
eukprot:775006_1